MHGIDENPGLPDVQFVPGTLVILTQSAVTA